jgi:hypothetical protein
VKAFSVLGLMLKRGANKHEKNRELWKQFEKDQSTRSLMFYMCILRSFLIIADEKERQELNGDGDPRICPLYHSSLPLFVGMELVKHISLLPLSDPIPAIPL